MITVIKTIALFISVLVLMPLVFFFLVGYFGRWFTLSPHRHSWLAKLKKH